MRGKFDGFMWGLILIAAGGLFMARNLGYEVDITPAFWMTVCAGLGALSFIRYSTDDLRHWGRLMPACLFAAFAVMIGLSQADVRDSLIAVPLFIGLAIPFAVAVITDPQKNYWAAIPLTIFSVLTLAALLENHTSGALPVALATFVIATPFFFVYFTQPKQWWAIIPAGILSSIGLTALLVALIPAMDNSGVKGAVVSLGFAATFGVLYLRRGIINTAWAQYPAIVFGIIAVLSALDNTGIDGWPLILIVAGVILLYTSLHSRRHVAS